MTLLVLSLLALVIGPILHRLAVTTRATLSFLDGFVFVVVGGIVVLVIAPHAVHLAGWPALLVAGAGLLLPGKIEQLLKHAAKKAHFAALMLGLLGLALHAAMDGVALRGHLAGVAGHEVIAWAIVLHRLPDSLTVWWLLVPAYGVRNAIWGLGMIAIATVAGYAFAAPLYQAVSLPWIGYFQALVAGSLLHVVMHMPHPMVGQLSGQKWQWPAGFGAICAVPLLFALMAIGGHTHGETTLPLEGIWDSFVQFTVESAPALLFAYLAAGLLYAYMPQASMTWLGKGNQLMQALKGMIFGMPLPLCSCGVIPVYRSLVQRGVSGAAGVAFLIATPELGFEALFLSLPLLGAEFTVLRMLCAAVVSVVVALVIGPFIQTKVVSSLLVDAVDPLHTKPARWWKVMQIGFADTVDTTAPWILLGLGIAAVGSYWINPTWLTSLPRGLDVPLMTLLGLPAYVCASGATPLAAMLIAKGLSPGAAIAFLMTGPATNATTFGVLKNQHGARVAFGFGVAVAVATVLFGYVVNSVLPSKVVAAHAQHAHAHQTLDWMSYASLIGLALVYAVSLLRQGPRQFVTHVFTTARQDREAEGQGCHDHDHDHAHQHDSTITTKPAGASCCGHSHDKHSHNE